MKTECTDILFVQDFFFLKCISHAFSLESRLQCFSGNSKDQTKWRETLNDLQQNIHHCPGNVTSVQWKVRRWEVEPEEDGHDLNWMADAIERAAGTPLQHCVSLCIVLLTQCWQIVEFPLVARENAKLPAASLLGVVPTELSNFTELSAIVINCQQLVMQLTCSVASSDTNKSLRPKIRNTSMAHTWIRLRIFSMFPILEFNQNNRN